MSDDLDLLYELDEACPTPVGFNKPYVPSAPATTSTDALQSSKDEVEKTLSTATTAEQNAHRALLDNPNDPDAQTAYDKAVAYRQLVEGQLAKIETDLENATKLEKRRREGVGDLQAQHDSLTAPRYSAGQKAEIVKNIRDTRATVDRVAAVLSSTSNLLALSNNLLDFDPSDFQTIANMLGSMETLVTSASDDPALNQAVQGIRKLLTESEFARTMNNLGVVLTDGVDWSNPTSVSRLSNLLGDGAWVKQGLSDVSKSIQVINAIDSQINNTLKAAEDLLGAASDIRNAACDFMDGAQKLVQGLGMIGSAIPTMPTFNLPSFANFGLDALTKILQVPLPTRSFNTLSKWTGLVTHNSDKFGDMLLNKATCGTKGASVEIKPPDTGFAAPLNLSDAIKLGLADRFNAKGVTGATPPTVHATPETASLLGETVPKPQHTQQDVANLLAEATAKMSSATRAANAATEAAREAWLRGEEALHAAGLAARAPEAERVALELEAERAKQRAAEAEVRRLEAERLAQEAELEAAEAQERLTKAEQDRSLSVTSYATTSVESTNREDDTTGIPMSKGPAETTQDWIDTLKDLTGIANNGTVYGDMLEDLGRSIHGLGVSATEESVADAVQGFLSFLGSQGILTNRLVDADFKNVVSVACAYYARRRIEKQNEPLPVVTPETVSEGIEASRFPTPGLPNSPLRQIEKNNPTGLRNLIGGAQSPKHALNLVMEEIPHLFLPPNWHERPELAAAVQLPFENYSVSVNAEDLVFRMICRTQSQLDEVQELRNLHETLQGIDEKTAKSLRQKALLQGYHGGGLGSTYTWLAEGRARVSGRPLIQELIEFLTHRPSDLRPLRDWLGRLGNFDRDLPRPRELTRAEHALTEQSYIYTSQKLFSLGNLFPALRQNADGLGGPGGIETVCFIVFAAILHRASKRTEAGQDPQDDLREARKLLDWVTHHEDLSSVLDALLEEEDV